MPEPRIVSLLGSATEIVYALGLERYLVGISHECDYPPESQSLPRLSRPRFDPSGLDSGAIDAEVRRCMEEYGSVYEIDRELLDRLRPTHVLTQAVCEVCAVPTDSAQAAVAALGPDVAVLSLDAHRIDEIFQTIHQVADAVGEGPRGDDLVADLRARLAAVARRVAGRPRPRVLLLEWLDPPFAPGHWVPEMIEMAGAECLAGTTGTPSVQIRWSDVAGLDPDALLIEPCGYDLEGAAADAGRHRQSLASVAPRPMQDGRVWLLHSAWFSRSGPRVVEGIETLANLLHPDASPEIPPPSADGPGQPVLRTVVAMKWPRNE